MANNDKHEILAPKLPLNILLVEDNPDDSELCQRVLQRSHLDVNVDVVATQDDFAERIGSEYYDVILSDYNLGPWNGMDAFKMLRQEGLATPFILVTGALGEQKAVECIQSGIADYILKDRLERLPVAILRAMEEYSLRAEHGRMQQSLQSSEAKFRTLAEAMPTAIFIEEGTRCCYVNPAAQKLTGHSREELFSMNFWELLLPDSRDAVLKQAIKSFHSEDSTKRYTVKILTKQKQLKRLQVTVGMFPLEGGLAALITAVELPDLPAAQSKIYNLRQFDLQSTHSELVLT
jgi:PAS domain S-box-containing protein